MRFGSNRCGVLRTGSIAALVATVAMIASSGCSDDKNATTPVPIGEDWPDPRRTIAGVMHVLIQAYENRDIARYKELFDQESFMFVFDPIDSEESPDIPPNWDWPAEQSSAENMFGSPIVQRIELDFVAGTPREVSKSDFGERPFPEGTMKVLVTEVELDVETREPGGGGDGLIHRVTGDQAIFFLYQDHDEVVDGLPVWKISSGATRKSAVSPLS